TGAVLRDGFDIRRAAVERRIPCFTSLDTFRAALQARIAGTQEYQVRPLREYRHQRAQSSVGAFN
ncbi:MAG TPA: hypothetical protein VI789_03695, partial [Dehalococcoidia bacterium]|nr:hypothetical protein [Dehalococcoidia bacterium]